jgi:hypothetical protein
LGVAAETEPESTNTMNRNMKARAQTGIGLAAMLAGVIACVPASAASPKTFCRPTAACLHWCHLPHYFV